MLSVSIIHAGCDVSGLFFGVFIIIVRVMESVKKSKYIFEFILDEE